ncbi:MAG: hypothetical protein ACFFD4_09380 [Candidatus Odinarchaeota archaeon]
MNPTERNKLIDIVAINDKGFRFSTFYANLGFDSEAISLLLAEEDYRGMTDAVLDLLALIKSGSDRIGSAEAGSATGGKTSSSANISLFQVVFRDYLLEKAFSYLYLYAQGFKQDSMVVLRSFIEYCLFSVWYDTVTKFWPAMGELWYTEDWTSNFEAHKMSIADYDFKIKRLKKSMANVALTKDEFEQKFLQEANPADFLLFLMKPICKNCSTKKRKVYLIDNVSVWDLDKAIKHFELDIPLKVRKSVSEPPLDEQEQLTGNAIIKERLAKRLELMTAISMRANGERLVIKFEKPYKPLFGHVHVTKCAFCNRNVAGQIIFQIPGINLVFIWLQKFLYESKQQIKKTKVLWKQLSDKFAHFSTSILPDVFEAPFSFYDENIDLFNPADMKMIFKDISQIIESYFTFQDELRQANGNQSDQIPVD